MSAILLSKAVFVDIHFFNAVAMLVQYVNPLVARRCGHNFKNAIFNTPLLIVICISSSNYVHRLMLWFKPLKLGWFWHLRWTTECTFNIKTVESVHIHFVLPCKIICGSAEVCHEFSGICSAHRHYLKQWWLLFRDKTHMIKKKWYHTPEYILTHYQCTPNDINPVIICVRFFN